MLYGIELARRNLAEPCEPRIKRLAIRHDRAEPRLEIVQTPPLRLRVRGKLPLDVRPGTRIDLNLIKRLQRQSAREAAGPIALGGLGRACLRGVALDGRWLTFVGARGGSALGRRAG